MGWGVAACSTAAGETACSPSWPLGGVGTVRKTKPNPTSNPPTMPISTIDARPGPMGLTPVSGVSIRAIRLDALAPACAARASPR